MAVADLPRGLFRSAKKATSGTGTPPSTHGKSKSQSSRAGSQTDVTSVAATSTDATSGTSDASSAISALTPAASKDTADAQSEKQPLSGTSSGLATLAPPQGGTGNLPQPDQGSGRQGQRAGEGSSQNQALSPHVTFDAAIDTSKGVARIVEAGVKTPMNFCLGLARGLRNTPLLYNDDTVRPQERVTDLSSGLKVAGKEFGLGLYDGISGLVMQPLKGAQKEGAVGAVKGFGKGIGGLFLKPAAGAWSIPAYAMQGVNAEFRNRFSKSWQNYIITSRLAQGKEDLERSSRQEQEEVTLRWVSKESDLKGYYQLKNKSKEAREGRRSPPVSHLPSPGPSNTRSIGQPLAASSPAAAAGPSTAASSGPLSSGEPPKTGFRHTWSFSFDKRRQLRAQKDAQAAKQAAAGASAPEVAHSDEMERAIRESVQQTSRGNAEEDAHIERAIRASLDELRLMSAAVDNSRGHDPRDVPSSSSAAAGSPPLTYDITDEEYQALIEEAVRQSLQAQVPPHGPDGEHSGTSASNSDGDDEDEELRRALKESLVVEEPRHNGEDDESLRRALQESESAHQEKQRMEAAALNEEDVVLAYVKRQSLAEEEFRRLKAKGKEAEGAEEQDEDLRRALEESLKPSGSGKAGGPS